MDTIFSARQIQEKCIEQQIPMYQVFVDLTVNIYTVNREALCSLTFIDMLIETTA